ncbi:putative holin-like toxin [uncultured Veillonella sp.]
MQGVRACPSYGRAVVTMSTYEALSLMISFGVLVATVIYKHL